MRTVLLIILVSSVYRVSAQPHGLILNELDNIIYGAQVTTEEEPRLRKQVYAWHPHWMERKNYGYDYKSISTLSYFSYEINEKTGHIRNSDKFDFLGSPVIDSAKAFGCRIELTASLFGGKKLRTFFASSTAQNNFINNVIWLLKMRGGNGVNLDFELLPGSQRDNFTAFVERISKRIKAEIPGGSLTIAIPGIDWRDGFDIEALSEHVDYFIMMGYDYYYAGSSHAGPTAPLYSHPDFGKHSLTKSLHLYQEKGMNLNQMILALPYYGRKYQTEADTTPSVKVKYIGSLTYEKAMRNVIPKYSGTFDPRTTTFYSIFQEGGKYYQYWYDTDISLAPKFDLAYTYDLAGVGIWALGYDRGYDQLWDLLDKKFSLDQPCPCEGEIFDIAGPAGDYPDKENSILTLRSPNGSRLKVIFEELSTEPGKDFLEIYDGEDITSPKIGTFSGWSVNTPEILSTTDALTFVFTSNDTITSSGYHMKWECMGDYRFYIKPLAVKEYSPIEKTIDPIYREEEEVELTRKKEENNIFNFDYLFKEGP